MNLLAAFVHCIQKLQSSICTSLATFHAQAKAFVNSIFALITAQERASAKEPNVQFLYTGESALHTNSAEPVTSRSVDLYI